MDSGYAQGDRWIEPMHRSLDQSLLGYYREEREMTQFGADETLLRQVAQFTGGSFNPDPRSVFNSGGRSVASTMRLWPALLAAAIALNVLELILRKWAGLRFRQSA